MSRYVDADKLLQTLIAVPMSAEQRNAIVKAINSEVCLQDVEGHHISQGERCSSSTRHDPLS
jgi:hypothetical protein